MSTLIRENIHQLANRLSQKQQLLFGSDAAEASDGSESGQEPPSSLFPQSRCTADSPPEDSKQDGEDTKSSIINPPSFLIDLLRGSNTSSSLTTVKRETISPESTCEESNSVQTSTSKNNKAAPNNNNISPWIRNAGRKKSHPVWSFFRDLKGNDGTGGVACLHCSWMGDDRSPNNLRTHLKKSHVTDGVFNKFSEKLAQTPTQPYVKRVRAGGILSGQQNGNETMANAALSFLDSIPRIDEVINITARVSDGPSENYDDFKMHEDPLMEEGCSSTEAEVNRSSTSPPLTSPPAPSDSASSAPSGGSPANNHLNNFIMAANPLVYINAVNALASGVKATNDFASGANSSLPPASSATAATASCSMECSSSSASSFSSSHGSAFSLNDGACVSLLMKMAIDLDLTMSYHKRKPDIELSFESNRTAEKSGGRGKVIALTDIGRQIRVTERVNGGPTDTELWTKTDFNQFHWAIRGKCTKVLHKQ